MAGHFPRQQSHGLSLKFIRELSTRRQLPQELIKGVHHFEGVSAVGTPDRGLPHADLQRKWFGGNSLSERWPLFTSSQDHQHALENYVHRNKRNGSIGRNQGDLVLIARFVYEMLLDILM
jgi:hypothetical protein